MPQTRQRLTVEDEPFLAVRSMSWNYSSRSVIEPHRHAWHQLLYACSGAMTVHAGRLSWMIPPGKAVFIPAGCNHSIRMWGEVAMRSLAFPVGNRETHVLEDDACRVLSVTPLLRELILRIISMPALDSRVEQHRRLLAVLLDEMRAAAVEPMMLPFPWIPARWRWRNECS